MPPDASAEDQLNLLNSGGIDTSRWKNTPPEQINKELLILRNLDPDWFKHQREMEKQELVNKGTNENATILAGSRRDVANIRADVLKNTGIKTQGQLNAAWIAASGKEPEERTKDEQSVVDYFPSLMKMLPDNKAQATDEQPARQIEEIRASRQHQKDLQDRFTTDPSIPKGSKPGVYDNKNGLEVLDAQGRRMGWLK